MKIDRQLNCRIAKQWTPKGLVNILPENAKAGMIIFMFEASGLPVVSNNGHTAFLLETDASINHNGIVIYNFYSAVEAISRLYKM